MAVDCVRGPWRKRRGTEVWFPLHSLERSQFTAGGDHSWCNTIIIGRRCRRRALSTSTPTLLTEQGRKGAKSNHSLDASCGDLGFHKMYRGLRLRRQNLLSFQASNQKFPAHKGGTSVTGRPPNGASAEVGLRLVAWCNAREN